MSNMKRAAAVAAGIAAVGLSAAPALAAAPAAPQRVNLTSMTIKVAHSFVTPNQIDTLTATLKAAGRTPIAGASVFLVERKLGAAKFSNPVPVATTDAQGQVTVNLLPTVKKGEIQEFGLVFNGDATYRGSRSGIIMISVI